VKTDIYIYDSMNFSKSYFNIARFAFFYFIKKNSEAHTELIDRFLHYVQLSTYESIRRGEILVQKYIIGAIAGIKDEIKQESPNEAFLNRSEDSCESHLGKNILGDFLQRGPINTVGISSARSFADELVNLRNLFRAHAIVLDISPLFDSPQICNLVLQTPACVSNL